MQFDERNDKNDKNKNRPCENYMILLWWLRFVAVPREMVQQLTVLHVCNCNGMRYLEVIGCEGAAAMCSLPNARWEALTSSLSRTFAALTGRGRLSGRQKWRPYLYAYNSTK
jgi:hypothetical protein